MSLSPRHRTVEVCGSYASQITESRTGATPCNPSGDVGLGASNVQFVVPLFIDSAAGDLHLAPGSPAIDSGNPALDFSLEAAPNGGRINAGGYGNTGEAQLSL